MEPNKYLTEIHKTVIDWLKFAEAKNAALLTGNLAIIFGITRIALFSDAQMYSLAWFYSFSIIGFCGLSALFCLLSIVPQIKLPFYFSKPPANGSKNLVFFGTIATHTPDSYAEELQKILETKFNQIERSLAGQIVINSQIACRKFSFFKFAAWSTLSAFLTPVIGLILILVCKE